MEDLFKDRDSVPQEEYVPTKWNKFWGKVADIFAVPFAFLMWGGLIIIAIIIVVAIIKLAISIVF